ncbi:pre-mRNA branch site protein p14 [Angomonas deanei]|uniref:RNA recognition motif. (A.k.a. RRM, RBD, or RNP domain), putative n=1 Tax=Angomonas deanei TaxID=59799 RepID=S9VJ84_9TRYP|nr:pre-mRNA branch site protein p14 [Angomonas deanei]EPY40899.1 pre-mRNA branch site protein p14 [Angomonas deanei]CAD2214434.1 RNA recognition motif. (a.k.a. RRM, RBD, or RNP domain), putative [Angomonas deanei]|eukprot:EPY33157.1 pre-mRNA branch site protein p14 [Angomonas deanei]
MSDERILLVAGLPSGLDGAILYEIFGEFGAVQQIRKGSSKITKGCAIVVYQQCEAARKAIEKLNNYQLQKRMLRITVYDENRDKRSLEKRKRKREVTYEYKKHIEEAANKTEEEGDE